MTPAPHLLRRAIQIGLLVLVALMPFHAFLSVWLGQITGHQTAIQAWKEVLLLLLVGLGLVYAIANRTARARLATAPIVLASIFALVAVIVSAASGPTLTTTVFGIKTDLEFIAPLVLALVVATPAFARQLTTVILAGAALVIGFALLQSTVLPPDFLAQFGYGPDTIPPYLTLDPSVGDYRFGSTLGGPNQLGTYLILPVALAVIVAWRRRQWYWLALPTAGLVAAYYTYSRSAWIGMVVAGFIVALALTPPRQRLLTAIIATVTTSAAAYLATTRQLVFHPAAGDLPSSDAQHLSSLQNGLSVVLTEPAGHGLGTIGPATLHTTATDAIIENNYLQIAYETSWLGAALFLALLTATAANLTRRLRTTPLAGAALASLAGVTVAALFLPAWTDTTTTLTTWTAAGAALGLEDDHV